MFWFLDGEPVTTDDFLTKSTGEARYCTRMDTVPLEPALGAGKTHPWRNNSSGAGLDFFRFDPHEESDPTSYRLADMRLAADHEADKQFAITVIGERGSAVDLFYRVNGGAAVQIGSLPAGRSSDVFLWNTESLAAGSYTIQSKVGLTTFTAPGVVVVNHSSQGQDAEAPKLQVDTPVAGHTFDGSLQLVGFALDNRRIATVEARLDSTIIDSFSPSDFDARARAAFPQLPNCSNAGFNRIVDTSSFAAGNYTLTVTAYDTAGNTTVHTASVTKQGGASPQLFVPPFTNLIQN
jgi:hypothetical protein